MNLHNSVQARRDDFFAPPDIENQYYSLKRALI